MGGPGETQIETDRRLIADKIGKLKRELVEVRRTRTLQRSRPQARAVPDGGPGRLHQRRQVDPVQPADPAEVVAEDMLFATLDPTLRT
jgi:GTP-binding protein HflX